MPGAGGLDAMPQLREGCPETKIVVLSAVASARMLEEACRQAAPGELLGQDRRRR